MSRVTMARALYERAIDRFGRVDQALKAVEELNELSQAICKHLQELSGDPASEHQRRLRDHVAEEMADVVIMVDQLAIIYDNHEQVREWKARKQARLRNRLDALDRADKMRAEARNHDT